MNDYKHSCVVDTEGYYKTLVLLLHKKVYDSPPLGEDGLPDWSQATSHMEWVPDSHTLAEGDRLIDTTPPEPRSHAQAPGFVRPQWDGEAWSEGATAEEIAAWDLEHPAPEPVVRPPTAEADRDAMLVDLEYRTTLLELGVN